MGPPVSVSIVIPTFKEAPNIEPLVERIFAALGPLGIQAEAIFVDDNSEDGTEELIEALAARFPVRILVRRSAKGLSSAVLAGFASAKHDVLVVMDADLQHPPEIIPQLVDRLQTDPVDFVVGSRYHAEGRIDGDWPWWRLAASRLATLPARPLTPVTDPLSGFFALRRGTWERAAALNPIGYKIALELYVKCRCRHPVEVPIQFAARTAGLSKLGGGVALRYLIHLVQLYRFRYPACFWVVGIVLAALAGLAVLIWLGLVACS